MLPINKAVYVGDTFCQRDYMCQVSKLKHLYLTGLILLSFFRPQNKPGYIKFKSSVLKQINPNLGGISRGSFLPLGCNETTSLKTILSFEFEYICYILYKILV